MWAPDHSSHCRLVGNPSFWSRPPSSWNCRPTQVNKTTAKATLTQMLSIVFHRMEAFDQRAREEAQAALHAMELNTQVGGELGLRPHTGRSQGYSGS